MATTRSGVGRGAEARTTACADEPWLRRVLRAPGLVFLLPAAATLALCLWGIDGRGAWRDEHATWWAASLAFEDLYRLTRNVDLAIAPYYVFMHLWVWVFGDSLTALRLPSALAMAVAGGLVGLLGRRLAGGTRGGLVAGLLFAVVPTVARYGQEARPYAFAMLATLLGFLALLRALERPGPWRWARYAATVPLMGWSHLVTLTVLAAHLAVVWRAWRPGDAFGESVGHGGSGSGGRAVVRAWALAVGGGLALVAPLVVLARTQSQQIAWNTPAWNDAASMPYMLFRSPVMTAVVLGGAAATLVAAARRRRSGRVRDPGRDPDRDPGRDPGGGRDPVPGRQLVPGPGPGPESRPRLTPLVLWASVPFLLTLATAHWLHLFLDRYLLFTVPAWILLATMGIRRLTTWPAGRLGLVARPATLPAALALVTLLALPARSDISRNSPNEPDYRSVAVAVLAEYRPGDGIAYTHRLKPRRALDYELRTGSRPRDVFLYETPRQRADYQAGECPDPGRCAAGHRRIWLVSAGGRGDEPFSGMERRKSRLLREEFRTVRTAEFENVRLLLLERVTRHR